VAPPVVVPPLPFPGDEGSITGWLADQSTTLLSCSLAGEIEAGFDRLSSNIPAFPADTGYEEAMQELVDEVTNSTDLCCYLTISNTGAAVLHVTLVHSIGKFSAGFGALSAFQGQSWLFLGR
jgi:hypothetical protein